MFNTNERFPTITGVAFISFATHSSSGTFLSFKTKSDGFPTHSAVQRFLRSFTVPPASVSHCSFTYNLALPWKICLMLRYVETLLLRTPSYVFSFQIKTYISSPFPVLLQ